MAFFGSNACSMTTIGFYTRGARFRRPIMTEHLDFNADLIHTVAFSCLFLMKVFTGLQWCTVRAVLKEWWQSERCRKSPIAEF